MPADKSKASMSQSGRMATRDAFKMLGLPRSATVDDINQTFKTKLSDIQTRNADKPDKLVQEADALYAAYRSAYLSKDNASEDQMLPLTITGPDTMLNMFGISDLPHQSLKVQMSSQAQYKDGQLVKQESNKQETFVNKDGKKETRVYENGKLVKHTIDGKDMLNK